MHTFRCSSKKTKHLFKTLFLTSLVVNQDILPASPGYSPLSSVWTTHFMRKKVYKINHLWLLCYTTISGSHGFGMDALFYGPAMYQWNHLGEKLISLPTVQEGNYKLKNIFKICFAVKLFQKFIKKLVVFF